eukprot:153209-Pleurochrysis_carterae.AAC.1
MSHRGSAGRPRDLLCSMATASTLSACAPPNRRDESRLHKRHRPCCANLSFISASNFPFSPSLLCALDPACGAGVRGASVGKQPAVHGRRGGAERFEQVAACAALEPLPTRLDARGAEGGLDADGRRSLVRFVEPAARRDARVVRRPADAARRHAEP